MTWSVVIATHTEDRWKNLESAVSSAYKQTRPPAEVIVVVDHNPQLFDRVSDEMGSRVSVYRNEETQGLSGCRNTGTKYSSADFVAFLDDDAAAEPEWLASMEETLVRTDVAGVGGLAVPAWESGSKPAWLPDEYLWVVGCHYRGHRTDAGPIRSPIGANMAFKRTDILAAGGFSPRFSSKPFNRCDDTEFAMRLARGTGHDVQFVPTAVVHHSVSEDRTKWKYFATRCLLEGRAKAALAAERGLATSTGTERAYVRHTLGPGALRELSKGVTGDASALVVAANIGIGLFLTSVGFLHGSLIVKRPIFNKPNTSPKESLKR